MAANREPLELSLAAVEEPRAAEPPLLSTLPGDPLRAIARLLDDDEDLFCFRLACKTTRDHCDRPVSATIRRAAFLRTRALTAYAWEELPGFVLEDTPRMLALASRVGCVAVLAELMDVRGCGAADGLPVRGVDACHAAASHGQLEALVWLRGRGLEWDASVSAGAAGGGRLEVLRYAHEHGCPWDSRTCWYAAEGGHLEVLRYLHEHGCPWESGTCWSAARGGHLEVLRYAHEHGCPWDWRVEPNTPYLPHIRAYVETLRLAAQHPPPLAHGV